MAREQPPWEQRGWLIYTWGQFDLSDAVAKLRAVPFDLRPRPNSGRLWLDVLWIFLLACMQCSVIPSITGRFVYVDLLTSWITITMIRQDLLRGTILATLTACILETHSTLPAGIYFCAYVVILAIITNLKDPLSWTHRMPWLVSIILANVWLVLFEVIVLSILNNQLPFFEWRLVINYVTRLAFAIPFGLALASRQMRMSFL